ncbi:MAG: VOC family protein [Acidimicrobiia bacterium]|nr:VOC family protein [Acidimicrobiia bacterium]MDH3398181.1 VOC family protein [Acidimicrobiia bacterium]MDH5615750.1 VOC family protein [Acidimicrobiia bacterium]
MNVRLSKISNIILRVGELERSLEFYRDRLGMTVLGASGTFAFLDGGGVTLVLNAIGTEMEANPPGLVEVVFEVDDVDAAHLALTEAGVQFRLEPRVVMSSDGRDLLAADLRDPDGNILSITGWRQVS